MESLILICFPLLQITLTNLTSALTIEAVFLKDQNQTSYLVSG